MPKMTIDYDGTVTEIPEVVDVNIQTLPVINPVTKIVLGYVLEITGKVIPSDSSLKVEGDTPTIVRSEN